MFKIGDFSRFTRVSVKMLRHYDHLGLLKPARIDPATNYRYYSADQLPRLNRLLALRDLGLSLEQIGPLLEAGAAGGPSSVEQIRGMLRLKQAELAQQVQEQQRRLDAIQARLRQIEREGQAATADVVVRRIAPQLMARLRLVVPDTDETHLLFEEAERHAARYNARASAPPVAVFYDGEYREEDVDMEVAIPLKHAIPSTDRIQVGELPGGESMACLVHTGTYDTIGAASEALLAWIEAHGYQIAGPTREVYLRFNADGLDVALPEAYLAPREEEFVTEIQLPVELKREASFPAPLQG
jgi:DNA-binding transcriptional MerR regulator/effector-binding domain-containing protein